MVEASFTGLIRTVLIIVGVFVVLRYFGQLMNAKRNVAEQEEMKAQEQKLRKEKEHKKKNFGRTEIIDKTRGSASDTEDVDFEEID